MGAVPTDILADLEPRITIWDLDRAEVVRTLAGFGDGSFDFDPNGDRLVAVAVALDTVARTEGSAAVLDVNGDARVTLAGSAFTEVAFSPDGARIAAGMEDGTVRLFDSSTGEELLVLRGHDRGGFGFLAFSTDGSMLASSDSFGPVRVWALDLDRLLEIARDEVTRSLTDEECRQYLHVDSCSVDASTVS
jgi:WD40 repeat protein